jgi:hypothetical protein
MSLLFAAALAASATTLPACSWDRPGANPYMGNVVTAVDRYSDIPESVRAALKTRMATRQYDDIAVIRRDTVVGKHLYSPEIRDMHFGQGQVCSTVTRTQWAPAAEERGLVYCERGHCIIGPTVCRNVSRVTRLPPDPAAGAAAEPAPGGEGPPGGGGVMLAGAMPEALSSTAADSGELAFEAPGAGPSFAQQADPAQPGQAVSTGPSPGAADGGTPLDDAVHALGGGLSGGTLVAGGPGVSLGAPSAGPVGRSPSSTNPWLPGSEIGSGRRPGGAGFPFDPGPLVLPPPPPVLVVPEPGTWALWLLGLAALAGAVRRSARVSS